MRRLPPGTKGQAGVGDGLRPRPGYGSNKKSLNPARTGDQCAEIVDRAQPTGRLTGVTRPTGLPIFRWGGITRTRLPAAIKDVSVQNPECADRLRDR
jgi:hypothetical protein